MARAMPALLTVLVVGALAPASGAERPASTARPTEAPSPVEVNAVAPLERDVLAQINRQRASHGLDPLRLNVQLVAAARGHSMAMATWGFFGHGSHGGRAFARRIKTFYPVLPGRAWAAGENLVWASPELSARQAVGMWLRSPEHRRNMLDASWREVGIGGVHALGAPGVYEGLDVTIVTADFGAR
jgi:uncharacterized protein YkwD